MQVAVKADFLDLEAGVVRKGGTTFEATDERYAEIKAKLPDFVDEAEAEAEQPKKAATRRTRAKKADAEK